MWRVTYKKVFHLLVPQQGSSRVCSALWFPASNGGLCLTPSFVKGATTDRTDTAKITYDLLFNTTFLYSVSLTARDTLQATCETVINVRKVDKLKQKKNPHKTQPVGSSKLSMQTKRLKNSKIPKDFTNVQCYALFCIFKPANCCQARQTPRKTPNYSPAWTKPRF